MTKYILIFILLLNLMPVYSQDELPEGAVKHNSEYPFYDMSIVQTGDWEELYPVPLHPTLNDFLTEVERVEILEKVNQRRRKLGRDTLLTRDLAYIWRPYVDVLNHEDPHYMPFWYMPTYRPIKEKNIRILPFSNININDTIIIRTSLDPKFKRGDMVESINNVSAADILAASFSERYNYMAFNILRSFHEHPSNYVVNIIRSNKKLSISTDGMKNALYPLGKLDGYNIKTFPDAQTGYIAINEFFMNNSHLIKTLRKAIKGFKKDGCNNVILDLRLNPGGNGHKFDELLSVFIPKTSIQYIRGLRIRVSKETINDYDFLTEDLIGTTVDIPKEVHLLSNVPLIPKMYIEGMNVYVLISRSTGSMAATFVNILQYNNAAKLVGEPLFHNALKYGGVLPYYSIFDNGSFYSHAVCAEEIDEYTKAVDGVVMPDIPIPYIAKDYLSGEDAMLEKLLTMIKDKL